VSRLPSRRLPGALALALALVLVAIAAAPCAEAFPPETRLRIVDEAIRLMPASLRLALENHREEVRRGALEPLAEEDGPEHRPPRDAGASIVRSPRRRPTSSPPSPVRPPSRRSAAASDGSPTS
jgi:hypothetical protein